MHRGQSGAVSGLVLLLAFLVGCASTPAGEGSGEGIGGGESSGAKFTAMLGYGFGNTDVDIDDGPDDDTDSSLLRFRFEAEGGKTSSKWGAGGTAELMWSDDDLFGEAYGDIEADELDIFLYAIFYIVKTDVFQLPLRFGLVYNQFGLDYDDPDWEYDAMTGGDRISLEPRLSIVKNKDLDWQIYGEVSGMWGYTWIDPDDADDDISSTTRWEAEIGSRLHYRQFFIGASYVMRWSHIGESDDEDYASIDRDVSGFMISGGVNF